MKRAISKSISLQTLLLLLAAPTFAQEQQMTANTTAYVPSVSAAASDLGLVDTTKKLSVIFSLTNETNLEEQGSSQDESATTLEVIPAYRISSQARVRAALAGQHSYNGLAETKLLNTTLSVVRDPIRLDDDTNLGLTAQLLLPTDKEAREKSSLRGGAGFVAKVNHQFRLAGKNANASYALNTYKYSHEFSRDADRSANTSYRLRHLATLDVNLNKRFDVGLSSYYQTGFTYDGVLREAYYLEESVSYSLQSNVEIALSHSTGGSLFEQGGREWAASFYDRSESTIGATVTVIY